jgi:transcriptional regulator with XRE-family HTH domain
MRFDLRKARHARGETIATVAAGTGLSRHTLMRVEAGSTPQAPTAKAIADYFGVPVSDLIDGSGSKVAA